MNRGIRLAVSPLALAAGVVLAGCAPAEVTSPAITVTITPAENRDPAPSPPPDPRPDVVWPLTGLSAEGVSADDIARPALAIKIPNDPKARPQSGPERADIMIEEYIGGLTRFVGVFHSDYTDGIGPIRSARPMDPDLVGSFGAPLVFSGAHASMLASLKKSGLILISEDLGDGGFFSPPGTHRPYATYGHPEEFAAQAVADGAGPATAQFAYAYPGEEATAALEGVAVTTIDLRFHSVAQPQWGWDTASETWLRVEDGVPHLAQDGSQLSATNIIILRVKTRTTFGQADAILIVDSAPGFVATGGQTIPILWSKASREDAFHLTTLDGDPVLLAPGQTWIELVPYKGSWTTAAWVKFDGVEQP